MTCLRRADMLCCLLTSMMFAQNRLPPLPAGAQIYMFGEMHGLAENEEIVCQYVAALHHRGLRDVIIEEDQGYEFAAHAYVDGRTGYLPSELCLRVAPLRVIRDFNSGKRRQDQIRVHLADVDSRAEAIYAHATDLRRRGVAVSEHADGVMAAAGKTQNAKLRRELRTLVFSMMALTQASLLEQESAKAVLMSKHGRKRLERISEML